MKHKLELRLLGEISITSDMQMTQPFWQKWRGTKDPHFEGEREQWKFLLKLNFQNTKITALGPITSWQISLEAMETVRDFIFLGSKITADGDGSNKIKRCLLLGRTAMTNLDSVLQNRNITLPTKFHLVKAMTFPLVMCGCESWTIKKAEHQGTDAFELWCWIRLLRAPWSARRSNQSILKEINPEYSLEELMMKLKLQYFDHLLWRVDSVEKILNLGKTESRRRRDEVVGWHHWLNGHAFEKVPGNGERQGSLVCCSPWGHNESDMTEWTRSNLFASFSVMSDSLRSHGLYSTRRLCPCDSPASVLKWVAISFSRWSFPPSDCPQVSSIAGRFFTFWASRESPKINWF